MQFDPFERQNSFYKYDIKISEEEINQILILARAKTTPKQTGMSTTFETLNVLNFPLLKNLRKQVISILDEKKLILRNNWAQLYNSKSFHCVHTHNNSDYSGIIYMQGKTPTLFYNRNFIPHFEKFENNKMLLFPSWIPHEVRPLQSDEDRLIISFNSTFIEDGEKI
jgi:hypothetical protein|tara:strand:- start:8 stop:508 length:501 start_codon:yes stop_codon:yes gene_type:complete